MEGRRGANPAAPAVAARDFLDAHLACALDLDPAFDTDAPNYEGDLRRAVRELSHGFTIVTDATTTVPHDESLLPVHEAAQKMLVRAGLSRTAEVVPFKVTELHVRKISAASGLTKETFATPEDAEAWLDAAP